MSEPAEKPKPKGLVTLKMKIKEVDPKTKPPTVEELAGDVSSTVAAAPSLFQRRAGVTAKAPTAFQRAEAVATAIAASVTAAPKAKAAEERTFATTRKANKAVAPAPAAAFNPFDAPAVPAAAVNPFNNADMFDEDDMFEEGAATLLPPVKAPATVKVAANTAVDPRLDALQSAIDESMSEIPYEEVTPAPYHPVDRKGFLQFVTARYGQFKLPQIFDKRINPKACDVQTLQTYKYQAFVREFMRAASPYRGILVYHGLGSGKTCTSIAAAEAIYGQRDKKIIVMTPATLKQNYLSELTKCGFRHQNLDNYWVSFPIKPPANQYFALMEVGLPEKYIASLVRKPEQQRVFWMPDLSKTKEEANFKSLEPWEQAAIREQINQVLMAKIEFISYNGITTKTLLKFVEEKTHFDNAVIVIDEVHNITRMMCKKIDPYLQANRLDAKGMPKPNKMSELVTPEKWVPSRPGDLKRYKRAFVLYRLLIQAQNSKIIALSGTPIVNNPTEIAILGNILHGYFHCVRTTLATVDDRKLAQVDAVLQRHPRVNYYAIQKAEGTSTLFFSMLDDNYYKMIDTETGGLVGVAQRDEDDDEQSDMPMTIYDLFTDIKPLIEEVGVRVEEKPVYMALPLFPPTVDDFKKFFVNESTANIENGLTFMKRMSGLVSYYKGSKKELMPEVTKDEVVKVTMSSLQVPKYTAARLQEIDVEDRTLPKKPGFDETEGWDEEKLMSYRFLSRSICNFVFPTDLERPLPRGKKDLTAAVDTKEITIGDGVADLSTDAAAVAEAEREAAATKQEDDAADDVVDTAFAEGAAPVNPFDEMYAEELANADMFEPEDNAAAAAGAPAPPVKRFKTYQEELAFALKELYRRRNTLFKMDPAAPPEEQLRMYSPKYAAILEKVRESPGSALVYSAFKTVEGLGTFAMGLEANGFAPIRIQGPENNLELAPETAASFLERPEQFRYIQYSGDSSAVERATLLNIFNMALEKLPPKIKGVLERSALSDSLNMTGEVCRVFMITGAGAEGLSLRNVRQVHIMEPHWNNVRTEQVKGRAVRICSHSTFERLEDRTVEVYTYVAQFDPEKIKTHQVDETIMNKDRGETTDQYIYGVASRKSRLSESFLDAIKKGAVDCQLNYWENDEIACQVGFDGSVNEFLYDPRVEEDIKMTRGQMREVPVAPGPAAASLAAKSVAPPKKGAVYEFGGKPYFSREVDGRRFLYRSQMNAETNSTRLAEVVRNEATGKNKIKRV